MNIKLRQRIAVPASKSSMGSTDTHSNPGWTAKKNGYKGDSASPCHTLSHSSNQQGIATVMPDTPTI
eukprot:scaffold375860_cov19-Prasinocladus_malaysianus.AAC.1